MLKPCPMCKKPAIEAFRPFCSKLCKDKDMLNWLNGAYVIPTPIAPEDAEDPELSSIQISPEHDLN